MFFSRFERLMAMRYLRSSKKEGFVSVMAIFSFLGIMLGVATLIIVMSVMNGFRQELLSRIVGVKGHVWVQSYGEPIVEDPQLFQKIQSSTNVKHITPMIERQAILLIKDQARGVNVEAMSLKDILKRPFLVDELEGRVSDFKDNAIWVGKRLCDKTGLALGHPLTLMIPNGTRTAFGTLPKQKTFVIAGIFDVGMTDYDQNMVFIPLDTGQSFFNLKNQITHVEVFVNDPDHAYQDALTLYDHLSKNYQVIDWQHGNSTFFQAVQIERNVMFIILTLIIVIAAFNVISSLIMLIQSKTRDISIIRTMGAKRSSILKIFFLTGATIGFVGTALGVILGLSFAMNIESIRHFIERFLGSDLFQAEIYFLSHLPSKVDINEVIAVVSISIGLSFLASLYPAWKASRMEPIEGLRS